MRSRSPSTTTASTARTLSASRPPARLRTTPLYAELRRRQHPGLVLFSSGTSGDPKAAVHDFTFLLDKFRVRRTALNTLNFLLFDHLGGVNTLLHTLSNGGVMVTVRDRSPDCVCAADRGLRVELLAGVADLPQPDADQRRAQANTTCRA